MAATSDTTYRHSAKVKFAKMFSDFQTTMNPLQKYFPMPESIARESFFDFVEKLTDAAGDSPAAKRIESPFEINQATPGAVVPTWRRKITNVVSEDLHISIPRAHGRTLGKTLPELLDIYGKQMTYEMARSSLRMMLKLLTFPYKINPIISGNAVGANGTIEYFEDKYRHMFRYPEGTSGTVTANVNTTSKRYRSPMDIQKFFHITALLQNYTGIGANTAGINKGTGVDQGKCLVICNNTTFAIFMDINTDKIGNADYFGKSILIGNAKIFSFQAFDFLVLPDDQFSNADARVTVAPDGGYPGSPAASRTASLSGAQFLAPFAQNLDPTNVNYEQVAAPLGGSNNPDLVTFPLPTAWDGIAARVLTADKGTSNNNISTGYAQTVGLHKFLIVHPNGFAFQKPKQFNFDPIVYKDKDKKFEQFKYAQWSMEGIRLFPGLVRELYCTDDTLSGIYVG